VCPRCGHVETWKGFACGERAMKVTRGAIHDA
jgi:hypothetical protein